jgi:dihydroorotase
VPVAPTYDLVIANARVIDPETKLDATRNVGIAKGKIAVMSSAPLAGRTSIDARGLVLAPGFIDVHAHGQDAENYRYYAMDGVTSAMELELGTDDVDAWYAERAGKALVNYGVSIGHMRVRMRVMKDSSRTYASGDAAHRAASDSEIALIRARIVDGLERGAIGVGFGLSYTPAASRWEVLEGFRAAAAVDAPVFVHMRYIGEQEPASSVDALEEVLAAAAVSGASLHVMHVHSSGLRATPRLLQMIREARARGLDVTTEAYPYTAGSSGIESALFDPGWQQALGIDYHDIEWAATGERLTASTFAIYRKQHGIVIVHMIPEDVVATAIASPLTFVASDARMQNGHGHPRSAGTFARVLGHDVRDTHTLSLMDALTKMTLMPARRLEHRLPAMRHKGRVQIGADADLVVFDPASVIDRATYAQPAQYSEGFEYVLVGGVPVVWHGKLREDSLPGRPLRAPPAPQRPIGAAALGDSDRGRPTGSDRTQRNGFHRQVGVGGRDATRGAPAQPKQATDRFAHPEGDDAMPNGLLAVSDARGDFLERDSSLTPDLAQDRQHVDVLRRAMPPESRLHDTLPHRRAAAAKDESDLFDRRAAQVERHHPRVPLLAVQSRCARNVGAGGSVGARDDSPCGEGAHPKYLGVRERMRRIVASANDYIRGGKRLRNGDAVTGSAVTVSLAPPLGCRTGRPFRVGQRVRAVECTRERD